LQEADLSDKLEIAELQVDTHSMAHFKYTIVSDFGSATDAHFIRGSALLVGDLGIDGFMSNVVNKLLDVLPLEHSSYQPLLDLLSIFVKELVRKMVNCKKVPFFTTSQGYFDTYLSQSNGKQK
jgi:hypothetical protein